MKSHGHRSFLRLVLIQALSVLFFCSSAQSPSFLPLTKITQTQGLSGINVRKIIRDPYGFMWIATQYGLNRFDGREFIQFTPNAPNPSRFIRGNGDVYDLAMQEDANALWALTAYDSLYQIDLKTCAIRQAYALPSMGTDGRPPWTTCMETNGNTLYIGSRDSLLFKFNLKEKRFERAVRLSRFADSSALVSGAVNKLMIDAAGNVWVFIEEKGILVLDSLLSKKIRFLPVSGSPVFTDLSQDGDRVYATTNKGLRIFSLPSGSEIRTDDVFPGLPEFLLKGDLHCIGRNGKQLTIAGKERLFDIDLQKESTREILFSKNYEDRKWLLVTHSLYRSDQGIWFGSQYGLGWIRNTATPFTAYYASMNGSGNRIEHSITLCGIDDTTAAVCSEEGLYFANLLNGNIYKRLDSTYYTVFRGPSDMLIASSERSGLHVLSRNWRQPERSLPSELIRIDTDLLISAAVYKDSLYFLASQYEKGLHIWNPSRRSLRTLTTRSPVNALRSNVINRLYLDSRRQLWILCDYAVSIYDPERETIRHLDLRKPDNGKPLGIIMDACEFQGHCWLAVYGMGAVQISANDKIGRIVSSREGISNLGVYKIFPLNADQLILSTNNGLSIIDASFNATNYFEYDGLQSNSFEEASGTQLGTDLLLGGINGFTRIDPSKFVSGTSAPELFFSSIQVRTPDRITDSFHLFLSSYSIPPEAIQTVISFSSPNYIHPEKIIYAYRIEERDEKWIVLGNINSVTLSELSPGHYNLLVRAANEDGIWSQPISLRLNFLPKWYQTWWFRAGAALLIMAAGYALYRGRINQLKKEQRIRTRLASDLHDDLGGTLNSVKVYANLALIRNKEQYLNQVKENVQSAITGMRDLIWVLDDTKNDTGHLLAKISQFALPLCEANGIHCIVKASDAARDFKLGQEEKRNLYMILKEGINNAVKYADATELKIEIGLRKKQLALALSDNGRSFDAESTAEGNGIRNMKRRSGDIRYRLMIIAAPGKGTALHLEKI